MQAKRLKRPRSLSLPAVMECAVHNSQKIIARMMGATEPATNELEEKNEDRVTGVLEVTEPWASPELDP